MCVCVRVYFVRKKHIVSKKYPYESNRELLNLNCIEFWKYVWYLTIIFMD